MAEKRCFKCNEIKPLGEFYAHRKMADGYLNKCKKCSKEDIRKNREANAEHYKKYEKKRSSLPHRKAIAKRVNDKWKTEHPDRRSANIAIGNAVRKGEINPLPCLICGEKAEAHHPDYSRPLDVIWLCSAHHKQAHAIFKSST